MHAQQQHAEPGLARTLPLPDELLVAILLLAAPPALADFDVQERRDRRRLLHVCCLVSKQLNRVAQPLLWRNVELYSSAPFDRFDPFAQLVHCIDAALEGPATARTLLVDFRGGATPASGDEGFAQAFRALPLVEELTLKNLNIGTLDLHTVGAASCLRKLVLHNVQIRQFHVTMRLPAVEDLACTRTQLLIPWDLGSPPSFVPLVHRGCLPGLKRLSVRDCRSFYDRGNLEYVASDGHLRHLTACQFDLHDDWSYAHLGIAIGSSPSPPPILWLFQPGIPLQRPSRDPSSPVLHYIQLAGARYDHPLASAPDPDEKPLVALSHLIEQCPQLRLVLVPRALEKAQGTLGVVCAARGIDLRWYESRTAETARSIIVPEFLAYLEEEQRARHDAV